MTKQRVSVVRVHSFFRWLAAFILILLAFAVALVGPIDRTPLQDQPFYQAMMKRLDTLDLPASTKGRLTSDWTKINITPDRSMPMAGYKPRAGFDHVHDSLYARIMLLENGEVSALLINVDLLLFPPLLRDRLEAKLSQRGLDRFFLYLSATHTHNGIGGWDDSVLGQLVLGDYHEEWVEKAATDIAEGISGLVAKPTSFRSWQVDAGEWIENRIAFDKGEKDGVLRGFVLAREDSSRALFFTYGAHATSIRKESRDLSADYPGVVIGLAEKHVDFAMYMAGMVGSHRFTWSPEQDFEFMSRIAASINDRISSGIAQGTQPVDSVSIGAVQVPIEFGPSQLRIAENWKVRDWVFEWLVRPLKGTLSYLTFGDVVLVGTPCDFSGEVYVREGLGRLAAHKGSQLIITSFNGDYNGYITYDGHYETLAKDEVRTMNWVGPYYGRYFSDMFRGLLGE